METLAVVGSLCKLTGRIAITWYFNAATAGVAASPVISMLPLVLCRSIGAAKVEGFDPILAIGCDNRYITYGVINPLPTAAGVVDGVVRGADERMEIGGCVSWWIDAVAASVLTSGGCIDATY